MSTELGQPLTLLNPVTGEVLAVDAPTEDLGRFLADVREVESMLREAKKVATRELLTRFDRDACWTVRAGDYKLTGQSPTPGEEFDELALREDLLKLADEGVISQEAVDKAVEPVVTYKVRKVGLNALRKIMRAAEVIDGHAKPVDRERRVSVSRA